MYKHFFKRFLDMIISEANKTIDIIDVNTNEISACEDLIDTISDHIDVCNQSITDQQVIMNDISSAIDAASALKLAEEALEDRLFELSLGDSSSLDVQKEKEAILYDNFARLFKLEETV